MKTPAKMSSRTKRLWETSRTVQVDICPEEVGFVASIGAVSLWLKHEEAKDMVATLTRALIRAAALQAGQEPDLGSEAVADALEELLRASN
jgi:hypothetical protein